MGPEWECPLEEGRGGFVVAYYCTGHGLGHATRTIQVARELLTTKQRDVKVIVVSSLPGHIFRNEFREEEETKRFAYRKIRPLDCGGVQMDAFKVLPVESLETYYELVSSLARDAEKEWLRDNKVSFVCSDTVPAACRLAKECGIPSAVISNLSWDFIYAEYLSMPEVATLEPELRKRYRVMVEGIVRDYECATFLFRLPGAHPMPAFDRAEAISWPKPPPPGAGRFGGRNGRPKTQVLEMPFVVRPARRTRGEVRRELGIGEDKKVVLLLFGGLSGDVSWEPDGSPRTLPPGWVCGIAHGIWPSGLALPREQFFRLPRDAYMPDVITASDVVLGKIGYGSVSECVVLRRPLIFVPRANFAEESYLRRILEENDTCVELSQGDFCAGNWADAIQRADLLRPSFVGEANGGRKCAQAILAFLDQCI